jgi:hypothetical protein
MSRSLLLALALLAVSCSKTTTPPPPACAKATPGTADAPPPPAHSTQKAAEPVADAGPPSPPRSPLVPKRTLRYREMFTGVLPARTHVETWTLVLGEDGLARLEHEKGTAPGNNLRVGHAKPLGPIENTVHEVLDGHWIPSAGGAFELRLDAHNDEPLHCRPGRVKTLQPGAQLVVPPHLHAPWRPSARTMVDVVQCERGWAAEEAMWEDEPQPADLPFADLPGIEYAHCNDDMVVQQGGLRRLESAAPPSPRP